MWARATATLPTTAPGRSPVGRTIVGGKGGTRETQASMRQTTAAWKIKVAGIDTIYKPMIGSKVVASKSGALQMS